MAAPYTGSSAFSNLFATAYDRAVDLQLWLEPQFGLLATKKTVSPTHQSNTVRMQLHAALGTATTPLNEITDPTGSALSNTEYVDITLAQYGDWTAVTDYVEAFALDNGLDSNIVTVLSRSMIDTKEELIEAKLATSTNRIYETNATGREIGVGAADSEFKARDLRYAVAKLRGAGVSPFAGGYLSYIHPDVSYDFQEETGETGWRYVHQNTGDAGASAIYAGELGTFHGVRFVETGRCGIVGTEYNTYVMGDGFLAEATQDPFHVVTGGVIVDPLNRKVPIGWKGRAGWALYRDEAMFKINTISSVA